jgi:glucoamylase
MELTHSLRQSETNLAKWIASQARRSTAAMEHAISATGLIRRRKDFGQTIVPLPGSVLASPVIANWDPDPDYFFHWLRDSAIVMRTVAELMEDASSQRERARWRRYFEDFVRFSLALSELDGARFLAQSRHRNATARDFRKFLRPDKEIRALKGGWLFGEPRFNADRTLDLMRWSRPQNDGPALRALACLRYLAAGGSQSEEIARLLRLDLDFTIRHAGQRSVGPWEESAHNTHHYHVALVQLGALVHGRGWVGRTGTRWQAAIDKLRAGLDRHWSKSRRAYSAIRPARGNAWLDASVLLAVWDADLPDGPHSVHDPRVQQTQSVIEQSFAAELPINRLRQNRPALGRYKGDTYFGGGAWYPTTLAAAGLYYRLAASGGRERAEWLRRGDGLMQTVRELTPRDGALSEQVDRSTGKQTSARHLTWSYAAFISAARARAQAIKRIGA